MMLQLILVTLSFSAESCNIHKKEKNTYRSPSGSCRFLPMWIFVDRIVLREDPQHLSNSCQVLWAWKIPVWELAVMLMPNYKRWCLFNLHMMMNKSWRRQPIIEYRLDRSSDDDVDDDEHISHCILDYQIWTDVQMLEKKTNRTMWTWSANYMDTE